MATDNVRLASRIVFVSSGSTVVYVPYPGRESEVETAFRRVPRVEARAETHTRLAEVPPPTTEVGDRLRHLLNGPKP